MCVLGEMDERWQDGAPLGKDPTYGSPTHIWCEGPYFSRTISLTEVGSNLRQLWAIARNIQNTRISLQTSCDPCVLLKYLSGKKIVGNLPFSYGLET